MFVDVFVFINDQLDYIHKYQQNPLQIQTQSENVFDLCVRSIYDENKSVKI